jgi:phage baseplate assembly protein W
MSTPDPGHPALPLTLNPTTGTFNTVAQDSLAEVRQCAKAILRTPRGQRIEQPALGLPDPRWHGTVDLDAIEATLNQWEDRAVWEAIASPVTGATVGVKITEVR